MDADPSDVPFTKVQVLEMRECIRPSAQLVPYTTSNDPIPEELSHILSRHLRTISSAISDLDVQHQLLQHLLLQTQRSREALVAERTRWESLKGIRSLPVEILAQIFHQTLEAMTITNPNHVGETDPFQMASLRLVCRRWNSVALNTPTLWRGVQLDLDRWNPGSTVMLSKFVEQWVERAGDASPPLRLAVVGTRERDIRAGEVAGTSQPAVELIRILFNERYRWTEWHLGSFILRRLARSGGLRGLVEQLGDPAPSHDDLDPFQLTIGRLSVLGITEKWTPYRLFRSVGDADHFSSLESLYLSHPDGRGLPRLKFDSYLPQSLRHLHICGGWQYPMDRLFQLPNLEELVFESASSCAFDAPSQSPLLQLSLKRLILIEHHAVSKLTQILRHLTLPSLKLIQICHGGFNSADDWRLQHLVQHFARRGSSGDLHLSLENSRLRRRGLVQALSSFEGINIDCLYVEDIDAVLNEGDVFSHLGHSIHSIACRTPPTLDSPNIPRALGILSALDPKLTLFVPHPVVDYSEDVKDILDFRYLSEYALGELFLHGVQGHQHQMMLNRFLRGRI
ncbi:hypothetical protein BKA70DRAFT_669243 [Coprinopsis sp. MPI-PUGE-AT-0042]|nr:hypothetical protein BKA70DRAFT_669243 [Coprinopsis sp. MPI-PUGE-AT-0042]